MLRKHALNIEGDRRVCHALQKHSEKISAPEINSASHLHHVAGKLLEIVSYFRNSIIRTKIALFMDVAAYSLV